MNKLYKNSLFLILSAFMVQQPVVAMAEGTSSTILGCIGSGLKYAVDTVKSDLSIGNNIVEHQSLLSQLAAAGRLHLYYKLIIMPLMVAKVTLSKSKKTQFNKSSMTDPFFNAWICSGVPILEEGVFTYLPQFTNNKLKESGYNTYNVPLDLSSIVFGICHRYGDNYIDRLIYSTVPTILNYTHQRYLQGRNLNGVPIISHCLNNVIFSAASQLLI